MAHRHLPLATFLCMLPLSACDCDENLDIYELPGVIAGTVCDLLSGAPLADTSVAFQPDASGFAETTAKTDDKGAFRLEQLPAGLGRLVVQSDGISRAFDLDVLEGETTVFQDPSCRDTPREGDVGAVEGTVCNRHVGELVMNAEVSLLLADGTHLLTETDDEGYFRLTDVPVGDHVVQIVAPGYSRSYLAEVRAEETFVVDAGLDCVRLDQSNGVVTGALCDPSESAGTPLVGAAVVVTDSAGEDFAEVTDIDGVFIAGPMALGRATVRVLRAPDVDVTVEAAVLAGRETAALFPALTCEDPGPGTDGGPGPDGGPAPDGGPGPDGGPTPPAETGGVKGRVCAPDGETFLAGATVWIDANGERYETTSAGDGSWELTGVPVGTWTATLTKGSFLTTLEVTVASGQVYVVPLGDCAVGQDHLKIAVVDGDWDNVYDVLVNVGVDPDIIDRYNGRDGENSWAGTLLGDYALLDTYDIVLINCGAAEDGFFDDANATTYVANLRQYIASGRSVYASDWAYDFVEKAFPNQIDFYRDDTWRNYAEAGEAVADIVATIPDLTLRAAMGQPTFLLKHQFDEWAVITAVDPSTRVYIRGPATTGERLGDGSFADADHFPDVPYTVGFTHGLGKLIYTSFHQEEANMNPDSERILQLLVFEL